MALDFSKGSDKQLAKLKARSDLPRDVRRGISAEISRRKDAALQKRLGAVRGNIQSARDALAKRGPSTKLQMENPTASRFQNKTGDLTRQSFDSARSRLQGRLRADDQEQENALKRRFAASGMLNSGAAIKTLENQKQEQDRNREDQLQGLDVAQSQAEIQNQQQTDQLNFQAENQARQRNLSRELQNADREFQDKVFNLDSTAKLAQLDLAVEQFQVDKDTTDFNKRLSKFEAQNSGGLFGGGGFLGLGTGTDSFEDTVV